MTHSLGARRCALCGEEKSTPRTGGIGVWTVVVNALREVGIELLAQESHYLHVRCAFRARRALWRVILKKER